MPCSDGGVPYPPSREEQLDTKMPAVLCGLVSNLGVDKVVEIVDWKEAGVTIQEFKEWWQLHMIKDHARRVREAKERERAELRTQALSKLTPEELKALNIK